MEIRKINTYIEETFSENGKTDGTQLRKVAVVAIVKNPLVGAYHQDLSPLIDHSAEIARLVTQKAVEAMGDFQVESYGKAAVVGLNGEQEHGVAMLTTIFGDILRNAVGGGKAWVSSMTKRAAAGAAIDIPLAYKDALYVRSHYDGMTVTLQDSPLPDEIAVIAVVANRGRLNARVGGITKDEVTVGDGQR
jgi:hypothetical protein